jgi:Kef-type K+ transport system membrane component KefB
MDVIITSLLDELFSKVWFELTFLLVVSLFAGFLFARFGQPRVLGYIVVGVVIGPSVLNIIRSSGTGVSPLPESVQMLALLGAIVLLFMIGLECDLKQVYGKRSIAIAFGGVIIPWLGGYLLALAMGFGSDAIFIGATLVATSVAITASVTSQLGLIGTPIAYAIVGAAVVDDVLGMIVLGITNNLVPGVAVDYGAIVLLIIGATLFIVVGAWVGSRYLTKLVFDVQVSGFRRKLPMSGFVLALAIAFLYAFIAEAIGITAIVGAFVAGTAFSGSPLRDGLRKGTTYLEALFVPLFFVSLGVAVDIRGVADALVFGLVLTLVAVVTKIVGCGASAKLTGMSWWDSLAVGVGMTPRLEIALVIAYYGLSNLIIDEKTYSVVVFMGLLTAVFAPALLTSVLKRGGHVLIPS